MAPPTIPTSCPAAFIAGDTVVFDEGPFSDPQRGAFDSATYTLGYEFRTTRGVRVTATAAAEGTGWRITLSGTQTLELKDRDTAGPEAVAVVVTATAGSERYTLRTGSVLVWPDPVTGSAWQSNDEEMLALVRTGIRDLLTRTVTSYSIAGRSFTFTDLPTMMRIEAWYAARVEAARGDGRFGRAIEVQFT